MMRLVTTALVLSLLSVPAGAQNQGTDIAGSVSNRDNTRLMGTVYDSDGNPLPKVEIFVTNDNAPATRVRSKTRKDGDYLVRSLLSIMTREETQGITIRATFELSGYQTVEATAGVARDTLARLYPILWKEGTTPAVDGVCMSLSGDVRNAKGKAIKSATIRFTSPEDPDFEVITQATKGSYEAILWRAPQKILMTVEAPGFDTWEKQFTLDLPERPDVMTSGTFHVSF